MFHLLIGFLILCGPMLVTSVYTLYANQSGSYRRKSTRSKMVFLPPVAGVVFLMTLVLNLLWVAVLAHDKPLFSTLNWQYFSTNPEAAVIVLALGCVAPALYWAVIRWYVRTCALVLDLDRRAYRTIDLAHVTIKERTGPWEDIEGICVRRASAEGNVTFYVSLKWRRASKMVSSLGGFSKRDRAEAFAARMSQELELPLVAAPCSWG